MQLKIIYEWKRNMQFFLFKTSGTAKEGAGSWFFFTINNWLRLIWKDTTQFFQNSTIFTLWHEMGNFHSLNWVERQIGARSKLFLHYQKFITLNLEGIPLRIFPKFNNFMGKNGQFLISQSSGAARRSGLMIFFHN